MIETQQRKDTTIHVISHTHWDREWYRTNQEFRVELVSVVDDVIDALQRQEGFFCFTLDGQAILLEDYLTMRPEQHETVRTLVRGGNLLVGPWYTQPDEFLVSGESLIRNLLTGIHTAALHGGAMRVGWVPDAFGHISQLPQIFRHFDITCAALTRGIGNELEEMETDFRWSSPDGSEVTVAHQVQGYYSGGLLGFPYFWGSVYSHLPSVELARERLLRLVEPGGKKPRSRHIALWNGADHLHPEPDLAHTLDRLEESMPGYRIIHSSVPEYVRGVERERSELPRIVGELRGSRYHPLLPSILSSRIHLKQRNAAVQRLLERHSEPIASIAALLSRFGPDVGKLDGYYYPGHALRESWKMLLQNHGHDSIGGCSIDQVHREMLPRFDQAEQIAQAVCTIAIGQAGSALSTDWIEGDTPAFVCFSPYDRPGLRTVVHDFRWSVNLTNRLRVVGKNGSPMPTQLLEVSEDRYRWLERETTAGDIAENAWWWSEVLRRMDRVGLHRFERVTDDDVDRLYLYLADETACSEKTLVELVQAFRAEDLRRTVTIEAIFYRHRIAFAAPLPALSVTAFAIRADTAADAGAPPAGDSPATAGPTGLRSAGRVSAGDRELYFEGNTLSVEDDASLSLHTSFGRFYRSVVSFWDEGDRGDSYDFSPTEDSAFALVPTDSVSVRALEEGPVRAALEVSFTARVPRGLVEDRSRRTSELVEMPLRFRLSVCMGSDKVEVDGELVNHAFDHRLRARFSAGIRATHILSDGQFSVERRPLSKPDTTGWAQRITEIRPHQSWVSIADSDTAICVHTDGLHEHEGLGDDEGRPIGEESAGADTSSLAVTLLRSFGWLSRGDLDTRKGQAGPMIATPDAQQIGRNRFRFSFRMLAGERFLKRSDCASRPTFLECLTAPTGNGQRGLDHQFSFVRFEGDELSLTAMKASVRVPGAVLIRFFNTSHEAVSRPVGISRLFDRATRVRLDETPLEEEDLQEGVMLIRAKPAEIITIRLEPAPRHRVERAWGAFRRQAEPRETKGPGAEV